MYYWKKKRKSTNRVILGGILMLEELKDLASKFATV